MKKYILLGILLIVALSCSVPKETVVALNNHQRKYVELPLSYANSFPSQTFDKWDSDYSKYNKLLTEDVLRTQMGMSYTKDGIKTWVCSNSAKPHVQLDTATLIADPKVILGNWRAVANRKFSFTDSAVYETKSIHRSSKLIYDEREAEVNLTVSEGKFQIIGKQKQGDNYRKVLSKNYRIDSGRYLLLYGSNLASANVSLIGKEGENLIMNQYAVIEDKIDGKYIVYKTIVTQLIFQKI